MKICFAGLVVLVICLSGCASSTKVGVSGVDRKQFFLLSEAEVNAAAALNHAKMVQAANSHGKSISVNDPEFRRLSVIAFALIRHVPVFREDARRWRWRVALIDSPELNAFCMAGGKITFYTGIIRRLNLSDDEIAAVMGHEISHALREHSRELMSQSAAQTLISQALLKKSPGSEDSVAKANLIAQYLLVLPFSRELESEADRMGLELAARAGYNPNAAISFWRKVTAANGQQQPEFLSTHPSDSSRISSLSKLVPNVMPLYLAAKEQKR